MIEYSQLWAVLPFPCFVLDEDVQILDMNSSAETLLAVSSKSAVGVPVSRFFGADSVLHDKITHVQKTGASLTQYDVIIAIPERPEMTATVFITPTGGQQNQTLLVIQTVGVAEQMSRSLIHLSAARSVTGMAAMLAHEIRNPLAGISGAAQLLAMTANEQDQELTDLIADETKRIGDLVDRVEHFGDLRPTERQGVNIHTVLDRAVRAASVGHAAHVDIKPDYDPSLPEVAGDADQLLQVFQNLIKNAAEACVKAKDTITIKTSYATGVKLSGLHGLHEELPLRIDITDTGKGIPDNLIDEIFDPFVSSKANGTGLGLSLVSKVIANHGGMIDCNCNDGKTTFTVRLPRWRGE